MLPANQLDCGNALQARENLLPLCPVGDEIKPKTLSITVNPAARKVIDDLRDDTGIPNTEALTRLLEWFAGLDRKFRLALLNRDAGTRAELARLTLEEMASAQLELPGAGRVHAFAHLVVPLDTYDGLARKAAADGVDVPTLLGRFVDDPAVFARQQIPPGGSSPPEPPPGSPRGKPAGRRR